MSSGHPTNRAERRAITFKRRFKHAGSKKKLSKYNKRKVMLSRIIH